MSATSHRVRVLVADDQPVAVAGTSHYLVQNGVDVCAIVDDLRRLLPVTEVQGPDLVLIETSMGAPGESFAAIDELLRSRPGTVVMSFTANLTLQAVEAALDIGCRGVLPKTATVDSLISAISVVASGERHLHPRAVALLLGRLRDPAPHVAATTLSGREREVLLHLAEGLTNRAVGEQLGISETTVKTHVAHVLRKLGAADRAQAVSRALRSGLIS